MKLNSDLTFNWGVTLYPYVHSCTEPKLEGPYIYFLGLSLEGGVEPNLVLRLNASNGDWKSGIKAKVDSSTS